MTDALGRAATTNDRAASTTQPPSASWVAYATCAWTLGYTALKLYWALGGTALRSTIGFPADVWRNRSFIVLGLWGTVAAGVLGALVALALARPRGSIVPRSLLLIAAWGACLVLVLRSLAGFVESGLRVAGVWSTAEGSATWDRWNLVLYSPYFLIWGALYGATAWLARRRP